MLAHRLELSPTRIPRAVYAISFVLEARPPAPEHSTACYLPKRVQINEEGSKNGQTTMSDCAKEAAPPFLEHRFTLACMFFVRGPTGLETKTRKKQQVLGEWSGPFAKNCLPPV